MGPPPRVMYMSQTTIMQVSEISVFSSMADLGAPCSRSTKVCLRFRKDGTAPPLDPPPPPVSSLTFRTVRDSFAVGMVFSLSCEMQCPFPPCRTRQSLYVLRPLDCLVSTLYSPNSFFPRLFSCRLLTSLRGPPSSYLQISSCLGVLQIHPSFLFTVFPPPCPPPPPKFLFFPALFPPLLRSRPGVAPGVAHCLLFLGIARGALSTCVNFSPDHTAIWVPLAFFWRPHSSATSFRRYLF